MSIVSRPIIANRPHRSSRNADGSHGRGHAGSKPAPCTCPACGRPMLECMGGYMDDVEAERDYMRRCKSGEFTLDSSGRPSRDRVRRKNGC